MASFTIVLKPDELAQWRDEAGLGTDSSFAERIGLDASQVSRVLRGINQPGIGFVAGVLDTFGAERFADLFAIIPDERGAA